MSEPTPPSPPGAGAEPELDPVLAPLRTLYAGRITRERAALKQLDDAGARLANLRTVTFLGAAGFALATWLNRLPQAGWLGAAACLLAYVMLAVRHDRVIGRAQRAHVRLTLNERGAARISGGWHGFAERGERFLDPAHLYTPDLDVFGQGSLFQLLDETATGAGEERLADWLRGAPASGLVDRQQMVKDLTPRLDFRQRLIAEARVAAREKSDVAPFVQWAEAPSGLTAIRWAKVMPFLLPPLSLGLYLAGRAGLIDPRLFWLGLLAQVGVVLLTRVAIAAVFARVAPGEHATQKFSRSFGAIERERFDHPALTGLQARLGTADAAASKQLARFDRVFTLVELRRNGQVHAVINALLLWDLIWFFRLERWRQAAGPRVRDWFDALATFEALGSLAGFAHDRPHFVFPTLVDGPTRLAAQGLGHPLLMTPVRNDVALPGPGRVLLVTGSNMSGKSTLLRATGLNTVMALTGLPVCAQSLELTPLHVLTSMRVTDSLEQGVSYFHAEVRRMKAVLDAAVAANGRAMFLLDELFLGTNTRDRQIASREVMRLLRDTGAIGGVTTHDLGLTDHGEAGIRNVYFRDTVADGRMVFDYRLREGVVDTTNALRLLEQAGIPLRTPAG